MTQPNQPHRFGPIAILLHWSVALVIVVVVALGLYLESLDLGDTKNLVLATHKSIGLTILGLMCVRVAWRLTHPAPPLPATMSQLQRWLANMTHVALYVVAFAMPLSGYTSVAARGRDTEFFGLFLVPTWVPLDRAWSNASETAHVYGQYVLYALVAAHVAAALYHHFIVRDDVLKRMWPKL
jgi:cytochrome b561